MKHRRSAILLSGFMLLFASAVGLAQVLVSFPDQARSTFSTAHSAPVQVYAAPQISVDPPRPLRPAIEPENLWTAGVDAQRERPLAQGEPPRDFDWSYRRRLPVRQLHGPGIRGARTYRLLVGDHPVWRHHMGVWRRELAVGT